MCVGLFGVFFFKKTKKKKVLLKSASTYLLSDLTSACLFVSVLFLICAHLKLTLNTKVQPLSKTAEKLRKKWEEEEEEVRRKQTPVYVEPKSKSFQNTPVM